MGVLTAALFFSSAFGSTDRLPPIPVLSATELGNFKPVVREQIKKAYERVHQNRKNGNANGQLGMILHTYKLYAHAKDFYRRAGLLQPDSFRWSYYLAIAQAHLGQKAKAINTLLTATGMKPEYLPARLRLAELLLASGKVEESEEIYARIAKDHPDSARAHYGLGQIHSTRGEVASAAQRYRRACDLSPGFAPAHYALAIAYRTLGNTSKSKKHLSLFRKTRERSSTLRDPLLAAVERLGLRGHVHYYAGVDLEREGQLQQAVMEYEKALKKDPCLWEAYSNLGFIYETLGESGIAEKRLRKAMEIKPDRWESHRNLGNFLRRKERYTEAAEAFRSALKINPFSADVHSSLAEVYAVRGKLHEAIRHSRLALEHNPHHRLARVNLGHILQNQDKHAEAIHHFLQAALTVEDERTPWLMYTLGNAYARTGDREKALHYLKEARRRALSYHQRDLVTDVDRILLQMSQAEDLP